MMELSGQGCTVYVFVIWIVLFVFRLTKIPIQVIGKCDGYNCTMLQMNLSTKWFLM